MRHLVSELRSHAHAWPFVEAVNPDEVIDYYDIIKEPMGKSNCTHYSTRLHIHDASIDLTQLEENVEKDQYITMDEFVADVQKIFDNCRLYNGEHTNYGRCANRLETYFNERLQVWTNGDY